MELLDGAGNRRGIMNFAGDLKLLSTSRPHHLLYSRRIEPQSVEFHYIHLFLPRLVYLSVVPSSSIPSHHHSVELTMVISH